MCATTCIHVRCVHVRSGFSRPTRCVLLCKLHPSHQAQSRVSPRLCAASKVLVWLCDGWFARKIYYINNMHMRMYMQHAQVHVQHLHACACIYLCRERSCTACMLLCANGALGVLPPTKLRSGRVTVLTLRSSHAAYGYAAYGTDFLLLTSYFLLLTPRTGRTSGAGRCEPCRRRCACSQRCTRPAPCRPRSRP